jgi:hypothetical protein
VLSVRDGLGADGGGEQVSVGFDRVEWTYTPASGSPVGFCWDVAAGKAC